MKIRIGIDIGGTKSIIAFIDEEGNILSKTKLETQKGEGFQEFASHLVMHICKLKDSLMGSFDIEIEGVGIGIAAQIDPETSMILGSPNLGWRNVNLKSFLESKLSLPVYIDNDVRSAVLGEYVYGFHKKYKNMILIAPGTGIGSGIILGGKVIRGMNNVAGEVGHIIYDKQGPPCNCGRIGCLESHSGGAYLGRRFQNFLSQRSRERQENYAQFFQPTKSEIDLKVIEKEKEKGNRLALEIWEYLLEPLGIVTANIVTLLNPEIVVLGGGLVEAAPSIVSYVERIIRNNSMVFALPNLIVTRSKLGVDAMVLGASILVDEREGRL